MIVLRKNIAYAYLMLWLENTLARNNFGECSDEKYIFEPYAKDLSYFYGDFFARMPVTKDLLYYHHSDRLGSGSVITSHLSGDPVHILAYIPYGETLLDLSDSTGYQMPHQFAGYEKDQESSLSYAEARYYSARRSIFTSVDPMWAKYPNISPYAYCANNPIMFVDPDGREFGDPLKNMKVRRNKVSNTFGYGVRTKIENGKRVPKNHQGTDYYAKSGTPALAVKDGTVAWTRNQDEGNSKKGYGNQILLKVQNENDETVYAFYGHLSEVHVKAGDKVKEGDQIGITGTTGNASDMTGEDEHLHFELRETDEKIGGMGKRRNPNEIVDTQFEPDPNNKGKVRQVQSNKQNETQPNNNNE